MGRVSGVFRRSGHNVLPEEFIQLLKVDSHIASRKSAQTDVSGTGDVWSQVRIFTNKTRRQKHKKKNRSLIVGSLGNYMAG